MSSSLAALVLDEELREGLKAHRLPWVSPSLCLQLLLHAPAPKPSAVGGSGRCDRLEPGSPLSSPQGITVPSLCFLLTAEAPVGTIVFLIRRDPDFGIPCLCLLVQPYSEGFPGTTPVRLFYVSFDERL